MWSTELRLIGPGGEPVDLRRTVASHGIAELPPMSVDPDLRGFGVTLAVDGAGPRQVRVEEGLRGRAKVSVAGRRPAAPAQAGIVAGIRRILSLDQDLSPFYSKVQSDRDLSWAAAGAGRMVRSPSVFEDVVKTICTTNCAWSGTVRMVGALVEHLGERAPGAPPTGAAGRAFPTPEAMAGAKDAFYRDVVRAGYRGRYLHELARSVAAGEVDLEVLALAAPEDVPDTEVEARLLALPGVGPYAAAHIMMLIGRHSLLILDSWTRPTYAKRVGRRAVKDEAIQRRFRRYGPYAGLAFWLFLTRDWVPEPVDASAEHVAERP